MLIGRWSGFFGIAGIVGIAGLASCAQQDDAFDTASRSSAVVTGSFGGKSYRLYVPSGYHSGTATPLVLMLHGCTQSAQGFEQATHMDTVAEAENFLVLYPEQTTSANAQKCWLWFDAANQSRGSGEPAFFASLIDNIRTSYTVDSSRVYVAGFSAGGGMTPVLSATYPDVFAAVAVNAGLEYKAGTSQIAGLLAMSSGGPDPVTQGRAAYTAMGKNARVVPTIVFYGASDGTVSPKNGEQVLSQAAATNDLADNGSADHSISDTPSETQSGSVSGGHTFKHTLFRDKGGQVVMEKYVVDGMSHAWSGGSTSSYGDPQGPDASALIWAFFKTHRLGSAPPPPTDGGVPDLASVDMRSSVDMSTNDMRTSVDMSTTPDASSGSAQTFTSIGAEDGFTGQLVADGASASTQKVGDKGMFNLDTYRLILSFDTSTIPAGAVLRGARLRIVRHALSGSVTQLSLAIKNGAFGNSAALGQDDYNAAATLSAIATQTPPAADGQAVEFILPASAFAAINRSGRTQFRISATTSASFPANQLTIYGGEEGANAPTLALDY